MIIIPLARPASNGNEPPNPDADAVACLAGATVASVQELLQIATTLKRHNLARMIATDLRQVADVLDPAGVLQ